jgi:AcrR family transcriptional regulator
MMLSDEVLMAYADGQLDANERARLEQLIAQDPEANARLEVFQATGRDLASVFDEHMNSPLPEKLSRLALYAQPLPVNKLLPVKRSSLGLVAEAFRSFVRPAHPFGLAAASAAMLIAGIGAGWLLHGGAGESGSPMSDLVQVESDGRTVARGPLSMALNNSQSGRETILPFAAGMVLRVAVKLSFRNHAQDYCRLYEAGLVGSENFGGIACNSNGQWDIKLQVQLAPAHPSAGRTAPAGTKGSALEAAVMSWIDGDALDQRDEDAMILKGWKKQ